MVYKWLKWLVAAREGHGLIFGLRGEDTRRAEGDDIRKHPPWKEKGVMDMILN